MSSTASSEIDKMLKQKKEGYAKQTQNYDLQTSENLNYMFFENLKTKNRFFFSVNKEAYNNKLMYIAGVYCYNVAKQQYIILEKEGFKKKDDAIASAKKQYELSI